MKSKRNVLKEDETIYEVVLESDSNDNVKLLDESNEKVVYEVVLESENLNEKSSSAYKYKAPKTDRRSTTKRTKKFGSQTPYSTKVSGADGRLSTKKKTKRVRPTGEGNVLKSGDSIYSQKPKKGYGMRKEAIEQVENLVRENQSLKNSLNKLETGIPQIEEKLKEYAVYNANATYALKLITENVCTADEKAAIVERFNGITDVNEAKSLFVKLSTELKDSKPNISINLEENIKLDSKIITESKDVITNQPLLENTSLSRIKQIINH